MGTLISDALDFRTKSHLFEALWIAASSPMCTDGIFEKIFNHLFPEYGQEDLEEPIYLYETVVDLAKDTLGNAKELRIRKAFEGLFNLLKALGSKQITQIGQLKADNFEVDHRKWRRP
jgi:hypothetical protein